MAGRNHGSLRLTSTSRLWLANSAAAPLRDAAPRFRGQREAVVGVRGGRFDADRSRGVEAPVRAWTRSRLDAAGAGRRRGSALAGHRARLCEILTLRHDDFVVALDIDADGLRELEAWHAARRPDGLMRPLHAPSRRASRRR